MMPVLNDFAYVYSIYLLISNSLVNSVKSTNIKHGYKTDHCLVELLIDKLYMESGPGMFKMNNSILLDKAYHNNLKEHMKETVRISEGCNPNTLWELIKGLLETKQSNIQCL